MDSEQSSTSATSCFATPALCISSPTHAIPALLQTADYTRAQELLRNGLDCAFYLHEVALDLRVGSLGEHVDQLQHLTLMANRKKIRIRIVPAAAGAQAGVAGPFTQLKFTKYESLVWTETENSSLFVETKEAAGGHEAAVQALDEISLNEDRSMELIAGRWRQDSDEPFPPE